MSFTPLKKNAALAFTSLQGLFISCLFVTLIGISNTVLYAQDCTTYPAFTTRLPASVGGNIKIKGDLTMIGNNIVNVKVKTDGTTIDNTLPNFNNPYKGNKQNNGQTIGYIDIDGDATTFSSSSANLNLSNCAKVKYAYLYWTAIYPYDTGDISDVNSNANKNNIVGVGETSATAGSTRKTDWNQVKFKGPGGTYQSLTADQVIWNGFIPTDPRYDPAYPSGNPSGGFGGCKDTPYVCVKDVTSQMAGLSALNGDYYVANMRASIGTRSSGGGGGWSLVVIFEDPAMTSKYISIFDGYQPIAPGNAPALINVNGFNTIPTGTVNVKLGVAALEGDLGNTGDSFSIKSNSKSTFTTISDAVNPANDFFNSTISIAGANNPNRNPDNVNTLGFDVDLITLINSSNSIIANNDTEAALKLTTSGDGYGVYLTTFAVDIIEPKINLIKRAFDIAGNDITGQPVVLGQTLDYKLTFNNSGNDNGTSFMIRDVLPINTGYTSIDVSGAPGTTYTYNTTTQQIDFTIPDNLVKAGGASYVIKIRVKVASSCENLKDACSNVIQNQAYSSYKGVTNPVLVTDDPSILGVNGCGFVSSGTSNILADLGSCNFTSINSMCTSLLALKAANGYDGYTWYNSSNAVIGTTQSINVTTPGIYKVVDTSTTCAGRTETITVTPYGSGTSNPIVPYANPGDVVTCPNDGSTLAKIYLCGVNDARLIHTSIGTATGIVWEKLDETSCPAVGTQDCANTDTSCTWNQVGTGADFNVTTAGQYRMVVNYGGCFERFCFNVFKNVLNPQATLKDIFCTTNGEIRVTNVPSGYEYQLIDQVTNNVLVPYQTNPVFPITTAGAYRVLIRQQGITGGCVFVLPDLGIINRNFQVNTIITNGTCTPLGSIRVQALNVNPQYYYTISGASSDSHGPLTTNDYTFSNLNPGNYTLTVKTDDGCNYSEPFVIAQPVLLTATSSLTQPLTCTDGEITVYPVGGIPPYGYAVNGSTVFQTLPQIDISNPLPAGGIYNIDVVDSQNCKVTTSITVAAIQAPVYTINKTDILCSGNTGAITVNVSNANGNILRYSIDNGVTFSNSPVFTNLTSGTYNVVIEYTVGTSVCTTNPQAITIASPTAIFGSAVLTVPYTCTGTATIDTQSVSGGTPTYTFSINGATFQSSGTFTGLTNGTYNVTVKDAKGCTLITNPVTVAALTPPTALTFAGTAVTCPSKTSNVTVASVTGGASPFVYEIVAPSSSAINNGGSNLFNNLAPGTYTFKVTDSKNCSYQDNYSINSITPIAVNGTLVSNVKCLGDSNGAVIFNVSGFSGNYGYQINLGSLIAGQTNPTILLTGKTTGNYSIIVKDNTTNCSASTSVAIDQPTAALVITSLDVVPKNCTAGGQVKINAKDGWGSYSYVLTLPDNTNLVPQSSNTFVNLNQTGTYTVTVTDANGCSVNSAFSLTNPIIPTAVINPVSDFCYDVADAASLVINTSGGIAPYEYQYNGGAYQSSNIFANLTPGNYDINVRDSFGCVATLPTQTIAQQLTVNGVLAKGLDCTASPDAVITNTIAGGYGSFVYQVKINGVGYGSVTNVVGNTFSYNASNPGTYQFLITDAKGCTVQSAIITIPSKQVPVATVSKTDISCNGANNGTITINTPSVGSGFQYGINKGVDNVGAVAFDSTQTFISLSPGNYYYYIRDEVSLCTGSENITIDEPAFGLTATGNATKLSCDSVTNTKNSATVTVTVNGGTAIYEYSFNGTAFSASNTFTVNDNGNDQPISYMVRDANGCLTTASTLTIAKLDPPIALSFSSAAITCSASTTAVTLTPTPNPGITPLSYSITAPAGSISNTSGQTNGIFTNLSPGAYSFKVVDNNGCFYTDSYTVDPVTNITVDGVRVNDVTCNGKNDGAIQFTISDIATVGNYTYSLTSVGSGANTAIKTKKGNTVDVTNLIADTYALTVADTAANCTSSSTVTIAQPNALDFTAVSTKVICSNYNSQITITPIGGTPVYQYAVVKQGSSAPSIFGSSNVLTMDTNLGSDLNWDVYIQDSKGCSFFKSIPTIVKDGTPSITAPVTQCYKGTGLSIAIAGITYNNNSQYSIGGGYQSSSTFSNVVPGNYTLSIKDDNNCITSVSYEIKPQLVISANLKKDLDCNGNATIDLSAQGGSGTYNYESSKDGAPFVTVTTNPFSTNAAGIYTFGVTDTQNPACLSITTAGISVTDLTTNTMSIVPAVTPVSCNGGNDGIISLIASGGLAPYTYSLNGGAYQSSNLFTDLAVGTYLVSVKDSKGCVIATPVSAVVTKLPDLTETHTLVPFVCSAANVKQAGTMTITPAGGTSPYQYSFNGSSFSTPSTYSLNDNGTTDQQVDYIVKDAKGCTVQGSYTFTKLNPPTELNISGTLINCAPQATTSTVTLDVPITGGGIAPLNYTLIAPVAGASQVSSVFSGLSADTYTFKVQDATGCYYNKSYTVDPTIQIKMTSKILNGVLCNGDATGVIEYTVTDYVGSFNVTTPIAGVIPVISGNKITVSGLIAGTYTLGITDSTTSCIASATDAITQPASLSLGAGAVAADVYCSNYFSIIAIAAATGGVSPYTYAAVKHLDLVPTTFVPSNVINVDTNSGNDLSWDVYVKDANGCIISTPLNVAVTKDGAPTVAVPLLADNQCISPGASYNVTLASGGMGKLPYAYSLGGAFQSALTFSVPPGTYTATVKDANGCTANSGTLVTVYPVLVASANYDKDKTCKLPKEASITITANGGSGNYEYYYSNDNGITYAQIPLNSNVFTTSISGNYIFEVIDVTTTCEIKINSTYTVTDPIPLILNIANIVSPLCNGDETGSFVPSVTSSGMSPFIYTVQKTDAPIKNYLTQTSGLFAGNYAVTVADAKGCTATANPVISQPTPLAFTVIANNVTCGVGTTGNSPGSIDVTVVSGGNPLYTYSIKNFNGYPNAPDKTDTAGNAPTYTGLNFGTYEVSIVDVNGCTLKKQVQVASPPSGINVTVNTAATTCAKGGVVDLEVTGAVLGGPFHFAIYKSPVPLYPGSDYIDAVDADGTPDPSNGKFGHFEGLLQGVVYSFIVYDESTHCYYFQTANTPTVKPSTVTDIQIISPVTCKGSANGSINFTVTGYADATSIDYSVFNAQTNQSFGSAYTGTFSALTLGGSENMVIPNLPKGNYYMVYKQNGGSVNGCTSGTTPFEIKESVVDFFVTANVVKNDNCKTSAGIISAVGQGGTGPYKYQIIQGAIVGTAPSATDPNWDDSNTFTVQSGNWVVWAKDAYNCVKSISASLPVTLDPSPQITATLLNPCVTEGNFSIEVNNTVNSGLSPFQARIDGGIFQPVSGLIYTFVNVSSGTHTVEMIDVNGCSDIETITILKPIIATTVLTSDKTCSVSAVITVDAQEGKASYTYEYSTTGTATWTSIPLNSNVLNTSVSGNYIFKVTDGNACTTTTNTVTVTEPALPTVAVVNVTSVSCNGLSDGTVLVSGNLGLAPYQYSIDNGSNWQMSNLFTESVGTYRITIKDSKNCINTVGATITQPNVLTATLIVSKDFKCGTGNAPLDAEVQVKLVSGGTSPYMYSYMGGIYVYSDVYNVSAPVNTSPVIGALVKDAHGCILNTAATVSIPALNPPTALGLSQDRKITCNVLDATLIATPVDVDGTSGYIYEILAPIAVSSQGTNTFSGLLPNNYLVKATDNDGCIITNSYKIDPVVNLQVSGQLISGVKCPGGNDGAIQFTVTDIATAGNYTYVLTSIATGSTTAVIVPPLGNIIDVTNLISDTYTLTVTDKATNCTDFSTFAINQPNALDFTTTSTKVICSNYNSLISIAPSGGTPVYQYAIVKQGSPAPSTFSLSNVLTVDTNLGNDLNWVVYIQDDKGCPFFKPINKIDRDAAPIITAPATQCYTGTGLGITITGTTYNNNPQYSIGGAYQSSATFSNMTPGNYTLSIRDDNNCIASVSYEIKSQLTISTNLKKDLDCNGNATIDLSAQGGSGTYIYEYSKDGSGYLAATTIPFSTNVAGSYVFRVKDNQSPACLALTNNPIEVTPITTLVLALTTPIVDVSCKGGNNGIITVTASGGLAPYMYSINGGTYQSSNLFSDLTPGNYSISTKDSKDCVIGTPLIVTVKEPNVLLSVSSDLPSFSCATSDSSQQPATVTLTGNGGTMPYLFSLNGGAYVSGTPMADFSVNNNGNDKLINFGALDNNGCVSTGTSFTIKALNPPTAMIINASTPVYCGSNATVTISGVSNGVLPLKYEIVSPASATGNITGQANGVFTGLLADDYVFKVTDANGCYITKPHTIDPVINIKVNGTPLNDVSCFGGNDGSVAFTVSDAYVAGGYIYALTPDLGTKTQNGNIVTVTGLPAGSYRLDVTDTKSTCQTSVNIPVVQPAKVSLIVTPSNINCNKDISEITVVGSGGASNYTYEAVVTGSPKPIISKVNSVLSVATNLGNDKVWDVYIQDQNSCWAMTSVTVNKDPLPVVSIITPINHICNAAPLNSNFDVSGSGVGSLQYSLNVVGQNPSSLFQLGTNFSVPLAGQYNVTVKDFNGCTSTSSNVTIYDPVKVVASASVQPSCTNNDGEITVAAVGGLSPYTFTISGPVSGTLTGNTFTNLASGLYTVIATDKNNCSSSIPVTLETPIPVTGLTASTTDVSCSGGSDGTLTVSLAVSNTNPIYKYSIAGPISIGPQDSNIFSGLLEGAYTITVTSGRNCTSPTTPPITAVVSGPSPLIISASATTFACDINNQAKVSTVTIASSGGIGVYKYSIDGTNYFTSKTFPIANAASSQTIPVWVKDNNGCKANNTVTVDPVKYISIAKATPIIPITCKNDEEVTINVTGGSGNYSYQLLPSGTALSTSVFDLKDPGTYEFKVTDNDTGCYVLTQPYTVAPFNTIDVVASATQLVKCFGDTNGALEINVSGYSGTYTYKVIDNLGTLIIPSTGGNTTINPMTINGLSGGDYTVEVTEMASPFCVKRSNAITVLSPTEPLVINAQETSNVTCSNNLGTITATATGGWGNYQYEFINNTTSKTVQAYGSANFISGQSAGTYTVNVKDANGCVAPSTLTLNVPAPIDFTASSNVATLSCNGNKNATITVSSVIGGQGTNYSYTLNTISPTTSASGPQQSPVFSGLGAGTYSVTVTDGYNCSTTSSPNIVIGEPTIVTADLGLVVPVTQTCFIQAQLILTASGGTSPYAYSTDNATYSGTPFTSSITIPVPVGTYHYYVKDLNGCVSEASNDITIDPIPALVVALDTSGAVVNCHGDTTASIMAIAEGGLGDYQYSLYDNSNTLIQGPQPSPYFSGLGSGFYYVEVKSSDCTKQSSVYEIKDPVLLEIINPVIQTDVLCNGDSNGSVTVKTMGGTGLVQVAISPSLNQFFSTDSNGVYKFENLAAGSYKVLVQDQSGCFILKDVTINEPAVLEATVDSVQQELCSGDKNGGFTLGVTGGTPPYFTSLDDVTYVQDKLTYTGLQGSVQSYVIYIKDANNCQTGQIVTLNPAVNLSIDKVDVTYNCASNVPGNKVIVTVNADQVNNVTYSKDGINYQTSNEFDNLPAGNYIMYAKHSNNLCIKTYPIVIDQKFPIVENSVLVSNASCNGSATGSITVSASGGTGTLQYAISSDYVYQSPNVFNNLKTGTYDIKVSDIIGCELLLPNNTITEPTAVAVTLNASTQELCSGDSSGSISVNISGGTAPYSTSLDNVTFVPNQTSFTNLVGGQTYMIYVKDVNGCSPVSTFTYNLNPSVDLQLTLSLADNCTNNTPTQTITAHINSALNAGDVQYSIDGGVTYQSSNVFSDLATGTYTIYAKHSNGCIKNQSISITTKTPVTANVANVVNANCNGSPTGSITVSASGGTGTLQYAISPNYVYQSSNVFNNLKAGTYDIKVLDAIGCEKVLANNTITEPTAVVVTLNTSTQELCSGDSSGSISVNISGGIAPYLTSMDNVTFLPNQTTYSGLSGGQTYTIYVKDAGGCTSFPIFTYNLNPSVDLQLTLSLADNCTNNAPTQTITAHINSVLNASDVQYSIDGGVTYQSSNVFSNLATGTYTIYAKHTNGCIKNQSISVTTKTPVTANVTNIVNANCNGSASGSITVTASSGTGSLQYAISPDYVYQTSNVFNNVTAGIYGVKVLDAIGCEVLISGTNVTEPTAIVTTLVSESQEICKGSKNGSVEISPSGGNPPYSTSLGSKENFVQDKYLYNGLTGGETYVIYIKDNNGCISQFSTTLKPPIDINAGSNVTFDCTNYNADITVNASVANNVSYSLDGGAPQPSNVFANLSPGTHTVVVEYQNNLCSSTVSFNLPNITPISLTLDNSAINEITAQTTGGAGKDTYTLNGSNEGTVNVYNINESGTYEVEVTDSNGCTAKQVIDMKFVDIELPNSFTPNGDGLHDTWAPTNTKSYPNLKVDIYDRYGRIISVIDVNNSWDGRYNGEPLPTGDYWYLIKLGDTENRQYVGHFTLYR